MQLAKRKRAEQGLTMLETLVGIMVIAAIVTALTPALVVAFATRIHNYRVQNAMKIAQGEIERVKLVVERGVYDATWTQQLPPSVGQTGAGNFDLDNSVQAPASGQYKGACKDWQVQGTDLTTSWCSVDINGDATNANWEQNWDLAVQMFRSSTPGTAYTTAGNQPIAFIMGVRVYTRAALKNSELTQFPRRDTAIAQTSNRQSLKLPLVIRYEVIARNDLDISRATYCELTQNLPGGSGQTCN